MRLTSGFISVGLLLLLMTSFVSDENHTSQLENKHFQIVMKLATGDSISVSPENDTVYFRDNIFRSIFLAKKSVTVFIPISITNESTFYSTTEGEDGIPFIEFKVDFRGEAASASGGYVNIVGTVAGKEIVGSIGLSQDDILFKTQWNFSGSQIEKQD